jgi:hypothetical protein
VVSDASAAEVMVPMRSRRRQRAQAGQKLQHVIATAGLLTAAFMTLTHDPHGFELWLAVAEIITSAFLITTFARSLRGFLPGRRHVPPSHGAHTHRGVDWVDIWAGGVLFVEAAETWRRTGHIWSPPFLAGVATLAIGLFHGRLASRRERQRSLRLTDDGLTIGARPPFNAFKAEWRDILSITTGEREAEIRTRGGRTRRIDLADLENAHDVRGALATAQRRVGATVP